MKAKLKIIAILLITILFTNCVMVAKLTKDSPPQIDFGTPVVGHFRNNNIAKGVIYTVLFSSFAIACILFSPGDDGNSVVGIDRSISDPIFYSALGGAIGSAGISSIDVAATYHMRNKKILELNGYEWDYKEKHDLYKHELIKKIQSEGIEEENEAAEEQLFQLNPYIPIDIINSNIA